MRLTPIVPRSSLTSCFGLFYFTYAMDFAAKEGLLVVYPLSRNNSFSKLTIYCWFLLSVEKKADRSLPKVTQKPPSTILDSIAAEKFPSTWIWANWNWSESKSPTLWREKCPLSPRKIRKLIGCPVVGWTWLRSLWTRTLMTIYFWRLGCNRAYRL